MTTTDTWKGTSSADWGASAANWTTGLPNSNNNVVINTSSILTITYSGGDTYVINSLSVGNDFFDMNGGSLTILTTANFTNHFTQTGGTLTAGGAVTISGNGTLTGGAAEGNTAFSITGTIALGNYTLGGHAVLNNAHVTSLTGQITVGDNTGINAEIANKLNAAFDIGGDFGIAQGAATASFVNAGTLEKTGGNGTSFIDINLTGGGAIKVNTGTVEFRGPNNSFAGAISGAGQFALGGGSNVIASGATIATGTFGIYDNGTNATLGENLSFAHAFNLEEGSSLNLGGHTLTLAATAVATFNNEGTTPPVIDGSGVLVTAHGSVSDVNNLTLGGTVNWQNSGTVNETAPLTIGDGSSNAATFTNESGGAYDLTNDSGIGRGAAATSSFVNAAGATFRKTAGTGDSTVGVAFTNNGVVTVGTGEIEFQATVGGSGTFNIVAGTLLGFDANVLSGSTVNFLSTSGGELVLLDSQQFQATIKGFGGSGTDSFDFRDINFNSGKFGLSYAGNTTQGVLTVADGTHTAHLKMLGDYTTANFHASSDNANGTLIVDPHSSALLAFGH